ncbi:hypothetical protein GUJ93_ZPchr0004g38429 [Zizania palustris]|uniref:DUF4220 domain-containing protein n=1 Tax=Zizania palustris TaxID=103762 RepID=A0A8J5V840_ZIZPA|nr:hypothetical protein GUJ93_ZPchr0004g38429 [Zizania palustris]
MAGDQWVMDIIWHSMVLAFNALVDVWNNWSMEILLGTSFVLQLVLAVTAGFRWRGAGAASVAVRNVIEFCYVVAGYVATAALGQFSVSGTSGKRQLVAFWAPFFLLHLGGPDSITAFKLQDTQLSSRDVMRLILRVVTTVYIIYKSISGCWALIVAAWLMFLVGVAKYVERTLALHRANLHNVRRSIQRKQQRRHRRSRSSLEGDRDSRRPPPPKLTFDKNDDDASLVMKAHALFHICKNSIVDSAVDTESDTDPAVAHTKETLFELDWKQLCRVMEMELSLMYDFLYTKAYVIHTWRGYCIRFISPVATTGSLVLVELSNKSGRHQRSDVVITRVLLVATFVLETASLVRALGSTWTNFFLQKNKAQLGWILHEIVCKRRWHQLHRLLALFGRLVNTQAHRRWSGNMGQLNMLQLTISERLGSGHDPSEYYIVIDQGVKELVFNLVKGHLKKLRENMKIEMEKTGSAVPRPERGQRALRTNNLRNELRWSLSDDLQIAILRWHIGTDIYLSISDKAKADAMKCTTVARKVMAIENMSNYMIYLLASHPEMLPGLVTRKLFELTRDDLALIWSKHHLPPSSSSPSSCLKFFMLRSNWWRISPKCTDRIREREELAKILKDDWEGSNINSYDLSRGIELAEELLKLETTNQTWRNASTVNVSIVDVIFEVWVEMLIYSGYRCSKESHARRLSYGGELTTILWLMAEHVGLFITGKPKPGITEKDSWRRRRDADKGASSEPPSMTARLSQQELETTVVPIYPYPLIPDE